LDASGGSLFLNLLGAAKAALIRAAASTQPFGCLQLMEQGKKIFPLRDAYVFADQHGLSAEGAAIRDMEIEWDRPYTSTVRRGRMIELFEKSGVLNQFINDAWPLGASSVGDVEKRRCLKISREYNEFLAGEPRPPEAEPEDVQASLEFALEAHLRDFLAKNLDRIEPGLRLYTDDNRIGIEYPIDHGQIDLLAVDSNGTHVVIELKLSRGRNRTLGQLLYYMGWVDQHLGIGPCRGVIIASEITDDLIVAVSRVPGVSLARYKMSFAVEPVK
jgi:hypothetical protein